MPNWWDYIHVNRSGDDSSSRLQEGLFQIATQTCSILVQVNNTNVTYNQCDPGPSCSRTSAPSTDVHVSMGKGDQSSLDREQSLDLLSKREKFIKRNSNVFANYKHRLSVRKE